jgi:hypothetical protein
MYRNPTILLPQPLPSSISFSALTKSDEYLDDDLQNQQGESRTLDGFLAFSEDGFVVNDGVCNVPSATASWVV